MTVQALNARVAAHANLNLARSHLLQAERLLTEAGDRDDARTIAEICQQLEVEQTVMRKAGLLR